MKFRYLILTLLVPALICCKKNEAPQPEPDQTETATITAADVSLEVNQSVQVNATTNSTASINYVADNSGVYTVDAAGKVTGVKAGEGSLKLTVDAVEGKFTAAEKSIKVTVTAPETPPTPGPDYTDVAPEVKNGDEVMATNPDVAKFLADIQYPTHDCSFTSLLTWAADNNVSVCPGTSDKPAEYSIRWTPDVAAGDVTVTVSEPTRDWVYTALPDAGYAEITNLLPNTHYTYKAVAGGKVLTEGAFDVVGKVHQVYFKNVRNSRDMGGWKTQDGKTVKYRMVYRGGRFDGLAKSGKRAIQVEGLKAELDLRGKSDVSSQSSLIGIVDNPEFCAPVIEEGYSQMLERDKEKTRQCMQFIFDMVDQNKPVYFHCSLGRDRTGTVGMLTLGILGVPEGDISQEYELTQFAPHGYATSSGEKTKMTRNVDYKGAANVIWKYVNEDAGETFRDGVEKYLIEIGISKADIDKFRTNMLQ